MKRLRMIAALVWGNIIISLVLISYLQWTHIDMTAPRLFLTYWPMYTTIIIGLTLASVLAGRVGRERR